MLVPGMEALATFQTIHVVHRCRDSLHGSPLLVALFLNALGKVLHLYPKTAGTSVELGKCARKNDCFFCFLDCLWCCQEFSPTLMFKSINTFF